MRPNALPGRLAMAALILSAAAPAAPQDLHPSRRPSPMGMARTTIDDAYVRVVYSRPYKRGRDNIFGTAESGALVPFGEVWRTGANEATEITLTGDLLVGGERLAAGTYSLFTVPGPESWTVHFNSALGLNGTARRNPESGRFESVELGPTDVLVVSADAAALEEEVDQFTIAFAEAEGGADMCLRWITTEVCVPFRAPAGRGGGFSHLRRLATRDGEKVRLDCKRPDRAARSPACRSSSAFPTSARAAIAR